MKKAILLLLLVLSFSACTTTRDKLNEPAESGAKTQSELNLDRPITHEYSQR